MNLLVHSLDAYAYAMYVNRGGIRGIVELNILAEIENAIGLGIRIQELFDLVIGTTTGRFGSSCQRS